MGAFLQAHETIAAPIIEWGGFLFLVALILSPFAIIAHRRFRPTRWWHVLGAYGASLGVFGSLGLIFLYSSVWDSLIDQLLTTQNPIQAYLDMQVNIVFALALIYPLTVFYSTKLLYRSFSATRLIVAAFLAGLTFAVWINFIFYLATLGVAALFYNLN